MPKKKPKTDSESEAKALREILELGLGSKVLNGDGSGCGGRGGGDMHLPTEAVFIYSPCSLDLALQGLAMHWSD
jgi:hypothetical protein